MFKVDYAPFNCAWVKYDVFVVGISGTTFKLLAPFGITAVLKTSEPQPVNVHL